MAIQRDKTGRYKNHEKIFGKNIAAIWGKKFDPKIYGSDILPNDDKMKKLKCNRFTHQDYVSHEKICILRSKMVEIEQYDEEFNEMFTYFKFKYKPLLYYN